MAPDFYDLARRGHAFGALKSATVTASLWAIGSAWSVAIRAIVLEVLPNDQMERVIAELAAAGITSVFGVTIAILAAKRWNCCDNVLPLSDPKPAVVRAHTLASRQSP